MIKYHYWVLTMKKILIFLSVLIFLFSMNISVCAEQYVLICKLKINAVNMLTNKIMRSYFIDRYFIVDTLLQGVYDANNLPLDVNEFTDSQLTFSKRAVSFSDIVDTRITYERGSHKMTLNEIYAYSSKYDQRARFVTKGEGSCREVKINRKPLF